MAPWGFGMKAPMLSLQRVVLLGAGHAHLPVLRDHATRPWPGVAMTLVTPRLTQLYSGRVPAWLAGDCARDDAEIPLAPLLASQRLRLCQARAVAVDAAARQVRLDDGRTLGYDLLSIDTGGAAADDEPGVPIRPLEALAAVWEPLLADLVRRQCTVVVAGGGAGGFELAAAVAERFRRLAGAGVVPSRVIWATGRRPALAEHGDAVRRRAFAALARLGVEIRPQRVTAAPPGLAVFDGASPALDCDLVLRATGARPPPWLADSGLALSDDGWLAVGPTQQSVSHPEVLAAGDVCQRIDRPHPRSGVYAVRAGPLLCRNLRRAAAGEPLQPHRFSPWSLNLLACGHREAIVSWGRFDDRGATLALAGGWAWRWKQRIDARFVEAQRRPVVPATGG